MYRSNYRIDVDILHALSGSFKSKKYVFIYPNNLMQTWTVWHISDWIISKIKNHSSSQTSGQKNEIIKQLKCKNYNYLYINNNHILCKFQHNFKQIVFQKRTKLFQIRTVSIYSNKKPLIFTDKWKNIN